MAEFSMVVSMFSDGPAGPVASPWAVPPIETMLE
jgi:hypothetical protein